MLSRFPATADFMVSYCQQHKYTSIILMLKVLRGCQCVPASLVGKVRHFLPFSESIQPQVHNMAREITQKKTTYVACFSSAAGTQDLLESVIALFKLFSPSKPAFDDIKSRFFKSSDARGNVQNLF